MDRSNKTDESILLLLKDIKDMLLGIALLLLGRFIMIFDSIFIAIGIILFVTGLCIVFQGYRAHKVVENSKSAENSEQ